MRKVPTAEEFRAVGYTADAVRFPLWPDAQVIKAELNGIAMEAMPEAWRYAPNRYCMEWWNWLVAERLSGRDIYQSPGRIRTPPKKTNI